MEAPSGSERRRGGGGGSGGARRRQTREPAGRARRLPARQLPPRRGATKRTARGPRRRRRHKAHGCPAVRPAVVPPSPSRAVLAGCRREAGRAPLAGPEGKAVRCVRASLRARSSFPSWLMRWGAGEKGGKNNNKKGVLSGMSLKNGSKRAAVCGLWCSPPHGVGACGRPDPWPKIQSPPQTNRVGQGKTGSPIPCPPFYV